MLDRLGADVLCRVAAYLDVPSVAALAGVNAELRDTLAGGEADALVWRRLAVAHGGAESLPRARHRSWARYLAAELYPARTLPLSGRASVFNQQYYCVVSSVTVARDRLSIRFHVTGNGSLGPLQRWQASRVYLRLQGGPVPMRTWDAATNGWVMRPGLPPPNLFPAGSVPSGDIDVDDPAREYAGSLHFELDWTRVANHLYGPPEVASRPGHFPASWTPGATFTPVLTYGESGYGECPLFPAPGLGRDFFDSHRMAHLLGVSAARQEAAAAAAALRAKAAAAEAPPPNT
jgi:hypothetical protein